MVVVTHDGYVKRVSLRSYSTNTEETYLKALASDISEKIGIIISKAASLPDSQSRDNFFTKAELISRMINVSNTLDSILNEFGSIETANNLNTAIVGGDVSLAIPAMF